MRYYVGILDGADDTWGVRIPDCPGCHGGGATPDAAINGAISALRESPAQMRAEGVAVAPARTMAEVLAQPRKPPGCGRWQKRGTRPADTRRGPYVRANVTFDAGLHEAIDAEAERRGLSRAAFLASAAHEKTEAWR